VPAITEDAKNVSRKKKTGNALIPEHPVRGKRKKRKNGLWTGLAVEEGGDFFFFFSREKEYGFAADQVDNHTGDEGE